MTVDLTIQPTCAEITALLSTPPQGELFGHPLREWRTKTRRELGLAPDRPLIATGHQTMLWHPGILAKYLLMDALIKRGDFAGANLIVDQHAGGYADLPIPEKRSNGRLNARLLRLTESHKDVPMALHDPFQPRPLPPGLNAALPSITHGITAIHRAIASHTNSPNAATQMAAALWDLMEPWVKPVPDVTATELMETTLARALLEHMVEDPHRMAETYNEAVRHFSGIGIGQLLIRDDYVEVPLWRIREDGRRMHAYDNDPRISARNPGEPDAPRLMPRALFMTALIRLGMCDLFIHGTGGANYDRAMELWIKNWLGITPSPIAIATATLHLPLGNSDEDDHNIPNLTTAIHNTRRAWHNPELVATNHQDGNFRSENSGGGPKKSGWLNQINSLPRNSPERKAAYYAMHRQLAELRSLHRDRIQQIAHQAEHAKQHAANAAIAQRRDWPFPLYPPDMLDKLAQAIQNHIQCLNPV